MTASNEGGIAVDFDAFERCAAALRGLQALNAVLLHATIGEDQGDWPSHVVGGLFEAQQCVASSLKTELEVARGESWRAHALLGTFGPEAKAKASAETTSAEAGTPA